jgi:uncharacterized repeat protein (TIGR03847 family)
VSTVFEHPDRFTTGTVGPPGARTFFLQAVQGGDLVSLKLEKQQVGALAQYLRGVLGDLPVVPLAERPTDLELVEPVLAAFVVGTLGVAYDQDADRIVLQADELVVDDDDDDDPLVEEILATGEHARFHLTRAQVIAFCDRADALVAAGRTPCPVCGQPMDPAGHACPRNN